jgi:L-lactate dehydrogenase complex protein LldG
METLFASFKARAEAVSAEVHRFPGTAQAVAFLRGFLAETGGEALWAPCAFRDAAGVSHRAVTREAAAAARVGVSQMGWALADTGTLVQDASAPEDRLVSTLPSIHVAVLGLDRLLPDLGALIERLGPVPPAYLSMITGPSRTADIERVLTIGVHGPDRLVILMVEGPAA